MKRTFIAVKIDAGEKLVKAVELIRDRLRNDSIKWVDLNQIHITLAFIGETSEDSIMDISGMLSDRCHNFSEVEYMIKSIGVFRNLADPRVIWAGVTNEERLIELFNLIKKGLDNLGIVKEDLRFKPHLTLGRIRSVKSQGSLGKLISEYNETVFQEGQISEVIYFESILQKTGPLYLPLKRVRLG